MDTRKFVTDVCNIQKQYAQMYYEHDDLVSICEDYIHLEPELFYSLCNEWNLKWNLERKESEKYPLEASMTLNNTRFICIGTFEDFRGVGLL